MILTIDLYDAEDRHYRCGVEVVLCHEQEKPSYYTVDAKRLMLMSEERLIDPDIALGLRGVAGDFEETAVEAYKAARAEARS